jgi:hypothetical protein
MKNIKYKKIYCKTIMLQLESLTVLKITKCKGYLQIYLPYIKTELMISLLNLLQHHVNIVHMHPEFSENLI